VDSVVGLTVRPLKPEDIPILESWAEVSGFEYPDLNHPHIEACLVVVDAEDMPVLAVPAKKLIEVYGLFNPHAGAQLRNDAIQLIQQPMADLLRRLGYECAEAFLPPQLERRGFGRILTKRFGWYRNYVSFGKRLI
jgi:hypothetical protein